MQAGVPSREASHRERSYNNSLNMPPGNGPVPPRRTSRGVGGGYDNPAHSMAAANTHYDTEGNVVTAEEWKVRGAAVGVREEVDADGKVHLKQVRKGVQDFIFGRTLGEGSYSTVLFATDRQTLIDHAVKILDKKHIIKEKKIKYVNIEKDTLNRLSDHPGKQDTGRLVKDRYPSIFFSLSTHAMTAPFYSDIPHRHHSIILHLPR